MKKCFLLFFSASSLLFQLPGGAAQIRQPSRQELSWLPKMELVVEGKTIFRDARLLHLAPDSLSLLLPLSPGMDQELVYQEHTFDLEGFDEILVTNRKKAWLYSIAGGVLLGGASFAVAKKVFDKPKEQFSINVIGQESQAGQFEPYLAGVLGLGLGVALGKTKAELKVFPKKDKKKAYWRMRAFLRN